MTERHGPALVLVGVPIGNLDDLAPRALAELERADSIACEDTRKTGALLSHFGVAHDPFIVCNDHTEAAAAAELVRRLGRGERVALVSDAGMPSISDPGRRVVDTVVGAGFDVTAVPGASAVVTALAVSGMVSDRFCFEGFLPRKGRDRTRRIEQLADEHRTTVIFESPRRLARTLVDLEAALDSRRNVIVARELTKRHEEVWRGSLDDAAEHWSQVEALGEIVIVLDGSEPAEIDDTTLEAALQQELAAGRSRRAAVDAIATRHDARKRRVYDLALELDWPHASEETPMPIVGNRFFSGSEFEERYGYSRAVAVGDSIYVAGTTGYDYATGQIADDATEQTRQTLRNIDAALSEFGSGLADVVQMVTYFVHHEDFEEIGSVLGEVLNDIRPVNSAIKAELISPDMRVEISATAVRGTED